METSKPEVPETADDKDQPKRLVETVNVILARLPMGARLSIAVALFWSLVFFVPQPPSTSQSIPKQQWTETEGRAQTPIKGVELGSEEHEQAAKTGGKFLEHKKIAPNGSDEGWTSFFDAKLTDYGILIFTFILTFLAVRQHHIAKTLERAYLSVEPLGIGALPATDQVIGYVGIRNVGKIPARRVRWIIKIETGVAERTAFEPSYSRTGNNVLPSGTMMRHGSDAITKDQIKNPISHYCYIWGRVDYDDGFDESRFTEFCHRYNCLAADENGQIAETQARYHADGNDAN